MRMQPRWFLPALWPIVAGLFWLAVGWRSGIMTGVISSLPGILLVGPGSALLLWPGDRQALHYMAFGGVVGCLVAIPMLFLAGWPWVVLLAFLAFGSWVTSGYAALYQKIDVTGAPRPVITPQTITKAALDSALLGYFIASAKVPAGNKAPFEADELEAARRCVQTHGWAENPAKLHTRPTPPEDAAVRIKRAGGRQYNHLTFSSDYEPHPDLPGGQRWMQYRANQNVHAWVFQHLDGSRPWVLGIHGYQMGIPLIDFSLFQINWLHHVMGCNVVLPVLPLHGPRKAYKRTGRGYLDDHFCNFLHAEIQAMRDLRRILAWIRSQDADADIGVLGFSLGGYNAALLASLEEQLKCVIAAIPMTDGPGTIWANIPRLHQSYLRSCGVTPQLFAEVMAPVSPLNIAPRVPHAHRYIVGATGDQLVGSEQPVQLSKHWDEPAFHWFQGSHLSVRREQSVNEFITKALQQSNLCVGDMANDGYLSTSEARK